MARSNTRRVEITNPASQKIMADNLELRIPDRGTNDDFDQLARNLNQMLDQIVQLRQQQASHQETVDQLQKETNSIHSEQKRIQGNLQSLGDRSSEKELRDRLVRTLNQQEDRLEEITKEIQRHVSEATRLREPISRLIGELEYDSDA